MLHEGIQVLPGILQGQDVQPSPSARSTLNFFGKYIFSRTRKDIKARWFSRREQSLDPLFFGGHVTHLWVKGSRFYYPKKVTKNRIFIGFKILSPGFDGCKFVRICMDSGWVCDRFAIVIGILSLFHLYLGDEIIRYRGWNHPFTGRTSQGLDFFFSNEISYLKKLDQLFGQQKNRCWKEYRFTFSP